MAIYDIGYLEYFGHKCVYVQDNMTYILIPVDEGDSIQRYWTKENYRINFSDAVNKCNTVSVKKPIGLGIQSVTLSLNYISKRLREEKIAAFVMTGNEIDEFFSPLEYYYAQKRQNKSMPGDLLYENDRIAEYSFTYKDKTIVVSLEYGNILSEGTRSDLKIRSNLVIEFEATDDTDFVFEVGRIIIKFLQFVNRKQFYNMRKFELYSVSKGCRTNMGYLFESLYDPSIHSNTKSEASFMYYGEKINNILDIVAKEPNFPIKHLDEKWNNTYSYSVARLGFVSAAFEYEYDRSHTLPQVNDSLNCVEEKTKIVNYIDGLAGTSTSIEEFKKVAKDRISAIGTQIGLKTKILNAFNENKCALNSSLESMLVRCDSVDKIAKGFSELRGKVLHSNTSYTFTDTERDYIRFVEILQYIMVLRRAGYNDSEISLIIGPLFHCNSDYIINLMKS